MKAQIKRTRTMLLTAVLLLTLFAPGLSVSAEGGSDPAALLLFDPCSGYVSLNGAQRPCEGDLVIPNSYSGLPVKMIGTSALSNTHITSVVIPDSVTSLTNGFNFDGCRQLQSVVISNNLSIIPRNAFSNCDVLASVKFGTGVTTIESYAFSSCPKLEYIELPKGIKEIGLCAFLDNSFLDGNGLQCAYYPGSASQWETVTVEDRTLAEHILYETSIREVASDVNGIKVTAAERTGAKTYTFYRQEKVNGTWTELAPIKTVNSATFVDETAVSGHTYRYEVTAANGPYTTRLSNSQKEIVFVPVTTTTKTKTTTTTKPTTTTTTGSTAITKTTTTTRTTTTTTKTTTTVKPAVVTTSKPTAIARPIVTTKPTTTTTRTTQIKRTTTTTIPTATTTTAAATVLTTDTTASSTEALPEATTTVPTTTTTTATTVSVATQPEPSPVNMWLILVIGILSGVVICCVVIIFVKHKK